MVVRAARGERWGDMKGARLSVLAGRFLKRLHTIHLKGFGRLELCDGKLQGKRSNWRSYITEHYNPDNTHKHLKKAGLTAAEFEKVQAAFSSVKNISWRTPNFLHNDYHGDHVFITGSRVTGLIDFEKSLDGDPRHDVARTLYFQDEAERRAFKSGYGKTADDHIVKEYMVLIAAGKVAWVYGSSLGRLKAGVKKRFRNTIAYASQR
jgi:aminoglycoside phosphotransferase (APT) family kinase protein